MIGLIIRLWLAILVNKGCSVGQPVDYYQWIDLHADYRVVWSTEGTIWGDYWLMQSGNEKMLFKFAQPIATTIGSRASHGACFRRISP